MHAIANKKTMSYFQNYIKIHVEHCTLSFVTKQTAKYKAKIP